MTERPKRPVRLDPALLNNIAAGETEGHLVERLYAALSEMPPDERMAAMVCFGFAEGSTGVAVELDLPEEDADALARSALQRLRGALSDVEIDEAEMYARLRRRRRRTSDPGAADAH
jgi:DNA-directed RNA polymerase specialized sigma24 family protein